MNTDYKLLGLREGARRGFLPTVWTIVRVMQSSSSSYSNQTFGNVSTVLRLNTNRGGAWCPPSLVGSSLSMFYGLALEFCCFLWCSFPFCVDATSWWLELVLSHLWSWWTMLFCPRWPWLLLVRAALLFARFMWADVELPTCLSFGLCWARMVCFAGGGVSCFFISCSHLVSIGKTLLSIAFLTRSAIPPQFHVGTSFVGRPFSQTHDVDKYEYLFNKRKPEGIKKCYNNSWTISQSLLKNTRIGNSTRKE